MWLNYNITPPIVYNNNTKKWIGSGTNRDASQVTVKQRINKVGIRFPYMNNPSRNFDNYADINNVNDALTRVRAGGEVAPLKKSVVTKVNNYSGYPKPHIILPAIKPPAYVQKKYYPKNSFFY